MAIGTQAVKSNTNQTKTAPNKEKANVGRDIDDSLKVTLPGFILSTGAKILRGEGPVEAGVDTVREAGRGIHNLRQRLGSWLTGQ